MKRNQTAGLTLIELMIVVAIVGILAILGTVGYGKIIRSSKTAEPTQMVGSIRLAQESYKAEVGNYAPVHTGFSQPNPMTQYCPPGAGVTNAATANGSRKYAWVTNCGTGLQFVVLPVHVDGPGQFGYATIAGGPADAVPNVTVGGSTVTFPVVHPEWYLVYANGDTNDDGVVVTVVGSSFTKDLWMQED